MTNIIVPASLTPYGVGVEQMGDMLGVYHGACQKSIYFGIRGELRCGCLIVAFDWTSNRNPRFYCSNLTNPSGIKNWISYWTGLDDSELEVAVQCE